MSTPAPSVTARPYEKMAAPISLVPAIGPKASIAHAPHGPTRAESVAGHYIPFAITGEVDGMRIVPRDAIARKHPRAPLTRLECLCTALRQNLTSIARCCWMTRRRCHVVNQWPWLHPAASLCRPIVIFNNLSNGCRREQTKNNPPNLVFIKPLRTGRCEGQRQRGSACNKCLKHGVTLSRCW